MTGVVLRDDSRSAVRFPPYGRDIEGRTVQQDGRLLRWYAMRRVSCLSLGKGGTIVSTSRTRPTRYGGALFFIREQFVPIASSVQRGRCSDSLSIFNDVAARVVSSTSHLASFVTRHRLDQSVSRFAECRSEVRELWISDMSGEPSGLLSRATS